MHALLLFTTLLCIGQINILIGSELPTINEKEPTGTEFPQNSAAEKLFKLMTSKKSNIGIHVNESIPLETLYTVIPLIAPYICLIKICIESCKNFSARDIDQLKNLAKSCNIMILQDSKFADSTEMVKAKYAEGLYGIAYWADFVTVHFAEGCGILKQLRNATLESNITDPRGAFVITQTPGLLTPSYTSAVLRAIEYRCSNEFIAGMVQVTKMPKVKKGLINIDSEEIPLDQGINTIVEYFNQMKKYEPDIYILKMPKVTFDCNAIKFAQELCWPSPQ
jgi:orotidine-5'-phosphate decarboxylase